MKKYVVVNCTIKEGNICEKNTVQINIQLKMECQNEKQTIYYIILFYFMFYIFCIKCDLSSGTNYYKNEQL